MIISAWCTIVERERRECRLNVTEDLVWCRRDYTHASRTTVYYHSHL